MRKTCAAVVMAVGLTGPGPAAAFDLPEAAVRLATIDSELTDCLQKRVLATVIVVKFLRECISDRRPDEKSLRSDLNGLISTLGGEDPDRGKALSIREGLNLIRAFMNQLDGGLKRLPVEIDLEAFALARAAACKDSGITGPDGRMSRPSFTPGEADFMICLDGDH